MDYMPLCINYVSWSNKNFKTVQVKKFPKNISKEVLQSAFKHMAFDILKEENTNFSNQSICDNYINLGQKMIDIFRNNDIYNQKTPQQRQEIEDFLRFHPENIEVSKHCFDRRYFDITDEFKIIDIKPTATKNVVFLYYRIMMNNLPKDFDNEKLLNFLINNFINTSYYREKSDKEKKSIINYLKNNTIFDKELNNNFCETMDWWIQDELNIMNFIMKKTLEIA